MRCNWLAYISLTFLRQNKCIILLDNIEKTGTKWIGIFHYRMMVTLLHLCHSCNNQLNQWFHWKIQSIRFFDLFLHVVISSYYVWNGGAFCLFQLLMSLMHCSVLYATQVTQLKSLISFPFACLLLPTFHRCLFVRQLVGLLTLLKRVSQDSIWDPSVLK